MSLTWHDSRQLGALLLDKYDTVNPMSVRVADLQSWVLNLEDFEGRPDESNEKLLEAIRKAWYEEWKREFGSR